MAGRLFYIRGAPAIINTNFNTEAGIANGTQCVFHAIILKNKAQVKMRRSSGGDSLLVPSVMASDVECIIFKHTLERYEKMKLDPRLPAGCFQVKSVRRKKQFWFRNNKIMCRIRGFEAVPAFCMTGHKMQGASKKEIVVGAYGGHGNNFDGWLYVVMSRVKKLGHFWAMEKISQILIDYKPRKDLMAEDERLIALHQKTTQLLNLYFS